MALGQWDRAEQFLLKAYKLDPHDLHRARNVAEYYMNMRDWQKAEYYIDKSLVSWPEVRRTYWFKAVIAFMGEGDTEKASRVIAEGIQCVGKQRMLKYRFEVDIWLRRYQELLDAVEQFPDFSDYFVYKGIAYWFMDQNEQANIYLDSARIIYEDLVQRVTHIPDNYSRLGLIYAGLGMNEKAIQTAKKAVDLEPLSDNKLKAPERYKWLAYVYSMVGEYDKALDEIELLLSIPYYYTTWDLKLNPFWDPMRDNPRFQELITKYSS
jgi:tetratricopeptide (TPR) repeat protein